MTDSSPPSETKGEFRAHWLQKGMHSMLPIMIASFREDRRPFDGELMLKRIEDKDLPQWLVKAFNFFNTHASKYLPAPEELNDQDAAIGFYEHMLNANQDITSLQDFSETKEAQARLMAGLKELPIEIHEEDLSLSEMQSMAKQRYQQEKQQGAVKIDLSNPSSLQKIALAQFNFQKKQEKARSQPQIPTALIAIMTFFPEIEEGQFRSVDAFYRFCEDERKKEGKALKFSEHTLRKICTKIGLNFSRLYGFKYHASSLE